ncbi:MAG: hypothetical protein R2882_04370 [Gemmatimonadales bacterium]
MVPSSPSSASDLVGTVIDPKVHRALQSVVARREALIFLDDARA